ncbi:hypothetical protein LX36DRAFT_733646 [Colletotrichum falcatum]|nr:hypothetical protein LX36DRAFT_733646 [Colletotrichum falcatum]
MESPEILSPSGGVSSERPSLKMVIGIALIVFTLVCYISGSQGPRCVSRVGPTEQTPVTPSQETDESDNALQHVCRVVRRLHAAQPSSSPELFEFLHLDPSKPPFHPPHKMAYQGRPSYQLCRDSIIKAWTLRFEESEMGSRGREEEVSILRGQIRHGDRGRGYSEVLHSVAAVLLEDDTRREYMDRVYPLIVASKKKNTLPNLDKACLPV